MANRLTHGFAGICDMRRAYLIYGAMVHRLSLAQPSARVSYDRFAQPWRFMVEPRHYADPKLNFEFA